MFAFRWSNAKCYDLLLESSAKKAFNFIITEMKNGALFAAVESQNKTVSHILDWHFSKLSNSVGKEVQEFRHTSSCTLIFPLMFSGILFAMQRIRTK